MRRRSLHSLLVVRTMLIANGALLAVFSGIYLVLGAKPGGDSYRPDEIAALSDATHQIGLDLHALRIDQLERDGSQLVEKVHRLEFENAVLRRVGPAFVET